MTSLLAALACSDGKPVPIDVPQVPVSIEVEAPWRVAHRDQGRVALQLQSSSDGVQVVWQTDERGRMPGVTPIHGGRALEVLGDRRWPWFTPADTEAALTGVEVRSEGPDLVVRLLGPPLSAYSDHPAAPADPSRVRIRVRHRGDTWRLAADGLAALHVDGELSLMPTSTGSARMAWSTQTPLPLPPDSAEGPATLRFEGRFGAAEGRVEGPRWKRATVDGHSVLDLSPSLTAWQPYPEMGFEWTP